MYALLGPKALFLSFFSLALSLRVPVKDVKDMGNVEKREALPEAGAAAQLANVFHQHEKRLVCIYDSILESLNRYPDDSIPFCSTFLGIQDTTATKTVTTKTTATTIFTTVETVTDPTITVAGQTVTVTIAQIVDRRAREKRQVSGSVTPFAALAAACTLSPVNQTLISRVSSGCSCLRIQPGTQDVFATITSTRTLSGIDFQQTTKQVTVTTDGTRTVTVTIPGPTIPSDTRTYGNPDTTTPPFSSYGPSNSTYPPGSGTGGGVSSTGTGILSTGTGIPGTGSGTSSTGSYTGKPTIPVDTRTQNPQGSPSGSFSLPPSSLNSTYPSGSGTGIGTGTSRGTGTGIGTGIGTGTSKGSYTGKPTIPVDTRTENPQTRNSTASASFTIPTSSYNITSRGTASTGIVIPPTNTSSYLPTATPKDFCDGRNGTIYITRCQAYLIICYADFEGPTFLGLFEESLNACIEDCAITNRGFSADTCYGLVYNTTSTSSTASNCFLKTQEGVDNPVVNRQILAAKLINNDTCATSSQPSIRPTGLTNSTFYPTPTGSLNFNISSRLGGSTSVPSASISPSYSGNGTSVKPTGPPFTLPTGSRGVGSGSSGFSTGYSNATSSWACGTSFVTSTVVVTSTSFTTLTAVPLPFAPN